MNRKFRTLTTVVAVAISWSLTVASSAQQNAENELIHQKLMETVGVQEIQTNGESVWKFGIRVTANGAARGITATYPIPIEWPEQTVVELEKNSTGNVNRVSLKKLTSNMHQMVVRINQLRNGEVAEATITFRVSKTAIEAPTDPNVFRFAKKVPSKVRKYLQPSPYIETKSKAVKAAAAGIEFAEDASDWEQVETIYRWVRQNVQYKFDTQIHSCMDALESGHGDCEELSSLFIAICRIKGIPARAVWIPGHTYPEFYMHDADGNGYWIPCQAAGSYAFGAMNEPRPILQKGDKFKVPGTKEPTRYVQPTLVAKDVEGAPTLEYISEQIIDDETGSNDR